MSLKRENSSTQYLDHKERKTGIHLLISGHRVILGIWTSGCPDVKACSTELFNLWTFNIWAASISGLLQFLDFWLSGNWVLLIYRTPGIHVPLCNHWLIVKRELKENSAKNISKFFFMCTQTVGKSNFKSQQIRDIRISPWCSEIILTLFSRVFILTATDTAQTIQS